MTARAVPVAARALVLSTLTAGCGTLVSTEDRACPCETGWTCCASNVCVAPGSSCDVPVDGGSSSEDECSGGILLGNGAADVAAASAGDAAVATSGVSGVSGVSGLSGKFLGVLPEDSASVVTFDYASSTSVSGGEETMTGWIVVAGGTVSYDFHIWAEDDASELPLQLVAFGPLEVGPTNGSCFAPLSGGGPMASDQGTFVPAVWGRYFIAPYHAVDVLADGSAAVQAAGDARYADAFLSMTPTPAP